MCESPEMDIFAWRKQAAVILGCVALGVPCVQQLLLKALISTIWTLTHNLQFLWRHFTILSKYMSEQSCCSIKPFHTEAGEQFNESSGRAA